MNSHLFRLNFLNRLFPGEASHSIPTEKTSRSECWNWFTIKNTFWCFLIDPALFSQFVKWFLNIEWSTTRRDINLFSHLWKTPCLYSEPCCPLSVCCTWLSIVCVLDSAGFHFLCSGLCCPLLSIVCILQLAVHCLYVLDLAVNCLCSGLCCHCVCFLDLAVCILQLAVLCLFAGLLFYYIPCCLFLYSGHLTVHCMCLDPVAHCVLDPVAHCIPDFAAICILDPVVCTFRLFNHAQQLKFTVRVIHSIPLMMSAVQVYFADKMAAVSHLIGTDHLPAHTQVSQVGPKHESLAARTRSCSFEWEAMCILWTLCGYRFLQTSSCLAQSQTIFKHFFKIQSSASKLVCFKFSLKS